jgi:hypothetical protein
LYISREGVTERYARIGSSPQVTFIFCKLFGIVVSSVRVIKFPPVLGPDVGSSEVILSVNWFSLPFPDKSIFSRYRPLILGKD